MLTFLTNFCEKNNNLLTPENITVGAYDRADLVQVFMTEKETEYFRKHKNFSGGKARKKFKEIMDSFCKWHYDVEIGKCVIEEMYSAPPIIKRRKTYKQTDEEIADKLLLLLLMEIKATPMKFKNGITILSLSEVLSFQNKNYYVYKKNRGQLAEFYGIDPQESVDFGDFISRRRDHIFKNLLEKMKAMGCADYEECWISQKVKTITTMENGKYVVREKKDKPRKAVANHVRFYNKTYKMLKKELGIPNNVNPYFSSQARRFKKRLTDELYNFGICSFHRGYVFSNINLNKIEAAIGDRTKFSMGTVYKKVRTLLEKNYAVSLGEDITEEKMKHFRVYVNTVVGSPVTSIRLDLLKMGREPKDILKTTSRLSTTVLDEGDVVTERG